MPSFWVDPADVSGGELVLRGSEAHHLSRSRRGRPGDRIRVLDGCGVRYDATVTSIDGDQVRCTIDGRHEEWGESPIRLCLVPALVKGQRFELIIEKSTEVGVDSIRPLIAARSVARPGGPEKLARWRRLARAAAKQCGRSRVPAVHTPASLVDVLGHLRREGRQLLLACPDASGAGVQQLRQQADVRSLGLLVGPEGGFAPEERGAVEAAGGLCFAWGRRILRAETACVVFSALVLHEACERARL